MCYKSVRTFFEFLCNIYEYKVYASGCRRRCCCSVLVDKFKTTCDTQFAPAFVLIHSKSCCEGPFFSHPTGCVGTRSTRIKGIDSKWFELIISKRLPDAPPPSSPPLPPKKRSAKKYKFKLNIASESLFAQCFAVSKEYFGADTRFPIDVCHMWTTLTWFIFSVVCSPCTWFQHRNKCVRMRWPNNPGYDFFTWVWQTKLSLYDSSCQCKTIWEN